jgi:integrase
MEQPKQLPSGTWTVRVRTGRRLPSGGWEQIRVTAPTRRMVEERARKVETERKVRKGDEIDDVRLVDFAERWYDWQRSRGCTEETVATSRSLLTTHWLPKLGQERVSTITPADINAVIDTHPGKLATLQRSRGAIRACFDYAWRLGLCNENPVKRSFAPVGEPTRKRRPPTQAEIGKALVEAGETYGAPMVVAIMLAADTGARRGELAALRWTDLDLATGVVTISRSLSVVKRARIEKGTKTGSVKTLHVTEPTRLALVDHWERLNAYGLGVPLFVVADDPGVSWLPDRIGKTWAAVADEVGIGEVHLHDVRHAFVTRLLSAGMAVTDVAGLAGHSKATMTLNVYGHESLTAAEEAKVILSGNAKTPDH